MRQHFRAAKAINIGFLLCPLLLEMLVNGKVTHFWWQERLESLKSSVAVDHPWNSLLKKLWSSTFIYGYRSEKVSQIPFHDICKTDTQETWKAEASYANATFYIWNFANVF